jgi:hypothetical protein
MTISNNKSKAVTMEGDVRGKVQTVINEEIMEKVNSFGYLQENIQKYNKLNRAIKRHSLKDMKPEIQFRVHNVLSETCPYVRSQTRAIRC